MDTHTSVLFTLSVSLHYLFQGGCSCSVQTGSGFCVVQCMKRLEWRLQEDVFLHGSIITFFTQSYGDLA